MNESDFYAAMNKPDVLPRVAEVTFYKTMADIRWDPTNCLEKLETVMGIGVADDHEINCRATFKFQGEKRVFTATMHVSNMVVLAGRPQDLIDACRRETEIAASTVVAGILEVFGTTIRDEIDRIHLNLSEVHKKALLMPPSQVLLIHTNKEQQVREMIAQQKGKDALLEGGFQIIISPDLPPDQILMTDGTKDGSALLKNVGKSEQPPAEKKKDALQDLIARRRRAAKWK